MASGTAIDVGVNSWVTEDEADTYFSTRYGAADYWVSGVDKEGAIITAYRWLMSNPAFSLSASLDADDNVKDAQCEMALFLIQHQPDIDLRMGLQAQGVREAGIVKEKYDGRSRLPVPPAVLAMLDASRMDTPIHLNNIERDENEDVTYDAPGHLFDEIEEIEG